MKRHKRGGQAFWDAEYKEGGHLALSTNPSEDLEKFTRWLFREQGRAMLNVTASVLDLGCGNGRNLIWLSETFGVRGVGYDISATGIALARKYSTDNKLPLSYEVRTIAPPLNVPDASQTFVLDMMTSHFLKEADRLSLVKEIFRVLKPGGFFFYKTFLLDEDHHAKRMLRDNPGTEAQTYVHPEIGVEEHVSTELEIDALYGEYFTIHKIHKSHRHRGKDGKRRSIVYYMEKPLF